MAETRFSYLFNQYYTGAASVSEEQELRTLLLSNEYDQELGELIKKGWKQSSTDVSFFAHGTKEKILNHILQPEVKVRKLRWLPRVAVAAAIILMAGGYYYFENNKQRRTTDTTIAAKDIAPGHAGAILTLSNGKQIVLDSANNGALAMEGSMQVVKENGEIKYVGENGETVYNDIKTDKGRTWSVTLPDGSRVWLNASSSIHYPLAFNGKERRVQVTGECYFEVKHNDQLPFRVEMADGTTIEDVGTAFNIKAYSDEAINKITLVEGAINIAKGKKKILLHPGKQAQIDGQGSITVATVDKMDEITAWKENRFRFRKTGLKEIFKDAARWYDMEVEFQEDVMDTYTVSMSREVPLSKLLQYIAQSGGVHFRIEGKKVIVLK